MEVCMGRGRSLIWYCDNLFAPTSLISYKIYSSRESSPVIRFLISDSCVKNSLHMFYKMAFISQNQLFTHRTSRYQIKVVDSVQPTHFTDIQKLLKCCLSVCLLYKKIIFFFHTFRSFFFFLVFLFHRNDIFKRFLM